MRFTPEKKDRLFLLLLVLVHLFGFLAAVTLSGVILLLVFLLFISNRKNNLTPRLLLTVFVLNFALITGPVAHERYFMPVMLVTSAATWIGYARLWTKWKTKKMTISAATT